MTDTMRLHFVPARSKSKSSFRQPQCIIRLQPVTPGDRSSCSRACAAELSSSWPGGRRASGTTSSKCSTPREMELVLSWSTPISLTKHTARKEPVLQSFVQ